MATPRSGRQPGFLGGLRQRAKAMSAAGGGPQVVGVGPPAALSLLKPVRGTVANYESDPARIARRR